MAEVFSRHSADRRKAAFTLAEVFSKHSVSYRKVAFTLAEVLITLGIIGIVAAMTMPSLIQKHNDKVTVVKLKKFMSVMNSAIQMAINEHGPVESWGLSANIGEWNEDGTEFIPIDNPQFKDYFVTNYILPYVKYIRYNSYLNTSVPTYTRYSLDGTQFSEFAERIILADGAVINGSWLSSPDCTVKVGNSKMLSNVCGEIFYDVNGKTPPNKTGEDVFMFYFTKYGVVPVGTEQQTGGAKFDNHCNKSVKHRLNGYGCTAWVIYNENLDYKYCNGLSWHGKKKCH